MFGFHTKIVESGSRLVITNPADTIMLILFMVFTVWPLLIFINQRPMPVRKVVICSVITLIVYGFSINATRLVLNRDTQTATVSHFQWFHWSTREFPMTRIASAFLATGNGTDRIVLQYTDGDTLTFSIPNQMGGKAGAVLAINRFLGREP